jgi:hypothetical protein
MAWKRKLRSWLSEDGKFRLRWFTLLLVGAVLAAWPSELIPRIEQHPKISEFSIHLIQALGEAMAIAAVIAGLVDEAAKRKFLREFAEDISTHIVGRLLPPLLREHIHHYLSVDFVRYNWEIVYRIDIAEEGFIRLETTTRYEMENRSPFERKFVVGYEVEESWSPDIGKTRITFVKARDLLHEQDLFERQEEELKTKKEGRFVKLCADRDMEIIIPGYDLQPQHRYSFELRSVEYFRDSFQTPFLALHPVLKTTLTVIYPKDRLEVDLSLTFDELDLAAHPEPIKEGKKWTIVRPILPGQGFFVRWDPVLPNGRKQIGSPVPAN